MSALSLLGEYFTGKALDAAGKVLTEIVTAPANPFHEIRQRMGGEAEFEFRLAFERHVRDQEARDGEFGKKLRERVTEREVCALFPSLLRAAAESSTRERMRLLCAALAGIWRPNLEAEQRSRIGRAVLELEPSDVLYLRRLQIAAQGPARFRLAPEGEWLVRAGCVANDSDQIGATIHITSVGYGLLESLKTWAPEK